MSQAVAQLPFLSVIVPMWNERAGVHCMAAEIGRSLDDLCRRGVFRSYELILVDDGSTDGTDLLIDDLARTDPRVVALHHDRNRGLGAGIRTGFGRARGDLLLYTDADLPCDPSAVEEAWALMQRKEAGMVSAFRFERRSEGARRFVYSRVYNAVVRLQFGLRVRDVNFAFKLLRRRVVDQFVLQSEGSFIDAELLIRAHRQGEHIAQFGVRYLPRVNGRSTLSSLGTIVGIVREMNGLRGDLRGTGRTGSRHENVSV